MRILLIVPACDGEDVGEAWVAYQWASRLAQRHALTVLAYHKRGHRPVGDQLPGVRVVEWEEPPVLGRMERVNSLMKPAYAPFYVKARRWIVDALARGEQFDVAHQPVPVAMRYPSPAAGLGIPLLMGPVGGGLSTPDGFTSQDTAPWYVQLRNLDGLRMRKDPLLRRTYETAACVLGIAPYVRENLFDLAIQRFEVLGETALTELPDPIDRRGRVGTVRLLFVGRLIRTKGARDAIAAISHLGDLDVALDIVGDGFDRKACEELTQRLGLGDRVTFHGSRTHAAVSAFYKRADVFVFPSYREPGGNVVFEAMGACLPLVVCDRGGPGHVVDAASGIRVPALDPHQLAVDIAGAVRTLVEDPELRLRMGEGARRRVAEVGLWSSKIKQAEHLYADLSTHGGDLRSARQ